MLDQLSHEGTQWERGQLVEFISSREVKWCEEYKSKNSYLNCGCRWKRRVIIPLRLWYFQASSFQLLKENLLRWSLFTFTYNRSTNMNYFICILHVISTLIHKSALYWSWVPCAMLAEKTIRYQCSFNMLFEYISLSQKGMTSAPHPRQQILTQGCGNHNTNVLSSKLWSSQLQYRLKLWNHLPRFCLGQTAVSICSFTSGKPRLTALKTSVSPRLFPVDLSRGEKQDAVGFE